MTNRGGNRMKRIIATLAVAVLMSLPAAASAAPSMCDIQEKLGVRNVKECEEPTR